MLLRPVSAVKVHAVNFRMNRCQLCLVVVMLYGREQPHVEGALFVFQAVQHSVPPGKRSLEVMAVREYLLPSAGAVFSTAPVLYIPVQWCKPP